MDKKDEIESNSDETMGMKIGPIVLMPDIEKRHLFTLFFGAFFGIASMAFVNVFNYSIFSALAIPEDQFGRLAGSLTAVQEVVVVSVIGFFGALSDKIGRRLVYSMGFFLLGIGYFLYPLADNTTELLFFRIFVALGCAANTVMLPTVANDYVHGSTRGRLIAFTSIANGLGLVLIISTFRNFSTFYEKLQPSDFLINLGYDSANWAQYTFWTASTMVFFVSIVLYMNLKKGTAEASAKKDSYFSTLKVAVKEAKNPRVALAYTAGVVSRGDLAVVSTFFALWLGIEFQSLGMSKAEAQKMAALLYVAVQACAIPGAIFINFFIDKFDRVVALAISMAIAACGYLYLGFIDDVTGYRMYFGVGLLGLGEIFANISAISLIGSVAPAKARGAVIGGFSFFGAVGIFLVAGIGGQLFDGISPTAPFTMVGIANLALLTLAILLLIYEGKNNKLINRGNDGA